MVLLPHGPTKKIRDCHVGDEVRTLKGAKRIARIWKMDPDKAPLDLEVTCLDGVWITSHHPVIASDEWVYPADLQPTAPWDKRKHVMPDMFNFELEGHDDSILLWGGGGLVVSCTIGKYLGSRFGYGICTRRSTRCAQACAQCDAVFIEGLEYDNLTPEQRWSRFPPFPQVEWMDGVSEFELARREIDNFTPPDLAASPSISVVPLPISATSCFDFESIAAMEKWLTSQSTMLESTMLVTAC